MKLLLRHQALLVLGSAAVLFILLGRPALFNAGEAIHVECSVEMFRGGSLIVPTFDQELRTDQPVLSNWLILEAFRLMDISELSARMPSALLAIGTVLLTYHLGRKLYSSDIGFLAGMILFSSVLFAAMGRAATPDMTLTFLVTASLTAYVWMAPPSRGASFCRGSVRKTRPQPAKTTETSEDQPARLSGPSPLMQYIASAWRSTLPTYVPLGLAVLTAGPIAVLLPGLALLLFLMISQRSDDVDSGAILPFDGPKWRRFVVTLVQLFNPRRMLAACLEMHLLIGLAVVAAIAVPWYTAVGVATQGTWPRRFLVDHVYQSIFSVVDGHDGFPLYFLYPTVALLLGGFPWSVFLPVAATRLYDRLSDGAAWRDSDRLLACWTGVWILFYSFAITKSPNSMLPIYPAVAVILSRYFIDWKRATGSDGVYSFGLCCRALWICGVVLMLGMALMAFLYFPAEQWLGVVGLVPILAGFIAARFLEREQRARVVQILQISAWLFAICFVALIPAHLRPYQDAPLFVAEAHSLAKSAEIKIATYRHSEPSLVFYMRKKVPILSTPLQVADFIASDPHAYVLTRASYLNELREELRAASGERARHRNFLKGYELILIGRL